MSDTNNAQAPAIDSIESTESQEAQTSQEGQEAAADQAAAPAEATKAEIKKALKKVPIKYNGKQEEVEFDPEDTEFLARQFQMAKLGQSKAQEFSTLEKLVSDFINELKANPRKVLADPRLGVDMKKIVEEYITEEVENSKKSPEQLEREKAQKELKALREEKEKLEKEYKEKEFARLQEQEYIRYDTQISEALDKSDLPKSPYIVKKMADWMLLGLQNNIDVEPQEVLPLVRTEIQNDLKEMFGVMPDELVEALVGKDVITRIRKKSIAKAKGQSPTAPTKNIKDVGKTKEVEKDVKKQTFKDFFKI